MAIRLLNPKNNEEIIVPSITFVATINDVIYNNCKPIFLDCDNYLLLDKKVFFLTNCDSRLLKVKSSQIPLLNFADSWISSVDIGVVKEDQKFWKIALEKLNIQPYGEVEYTGLGKTCVGAQVANRGFCRIWCSQCSEHGRAGNRMEHVL